MDSAVDFWYPPSGCVLNSLVADVPDCTVTIEQPRDMEYHFPTRLSIHNDEQSVLTDRLRADATIRTVEEFGSHGSTQLYLIEWADSVQTFFAPFISDGSRIDTIRHARADEGWHLRALFPRRQAVKDVYDHLVERGQPPQLVQISDLTDDNSNGRAPLLPDP